MTLKRQLLLLSLVILSLPWAGCELVREMESGMRQTQLRDLHSSTRTLAKLLPEQFSAQPSDADSLYAGVAAIKPVIDGYGEEWQKQPAQHFESTRQDADTHNNDPIRVSIQSQIYADHLYVFISVQDRDIRYHNPGLSTQANGDHLVLWMGQPSATRRYTAYTAAPGQLKISGDKQSRRNHGIAGIWQDTNTGYQLELRIPLQRLDGHFGVAVADHSGLTIGNTSTANPAPALERYRPELEPLLQAFAAPGTHLQAFSQQGWLLAEAASPTPAPEQSTFWLLRTLYRALLKNTAQQPLPANTTLPELRTALAGHAAQNIYRGDRAAYQDLANQTLLVTAQPIHDGSQSAGAILALRSTESYLTLTDQALSQALGRALAAVGLAIVALVSYAGWLSWRIRRLSLAAASTVSENGTLQNHFKRSKGSDELSELSRRYGELVEQISEHHDYLRTLNSKLSHELRTPLAIIRSSLEHLESAISANNEVYIQRAKDGIERLSTLLNRMSEASVLQQSIHSNPKQRIHLNPLLTELCAAYRSIYCHHELKLLLPKQPVFIVASADLLVQMLDKLLDNATSFAPLDSTIVLSLKVDSDQALLTVANPGPTLPKTLQKQLFEPMISVRPSSDSLPHLGLGLHIVHLICQYHDAQIQAESWPDHQGVNFIVSLPMDNSPLHTPPL